MTERDTEKKNDSYHGGDALLDAILQEGIDYVFGIPGGEFLPFLDAVERRESEKDEIHYIGVRHEQCAANMAEGYARVSGKAAIAAATVGPGFIDLIPGVAPAYFDSVPMLVIHPQTDLKFDEYGRLQQGLDQLKMMEPIVKYQKTISDPNRIIWAAQKTFKALNSGRQRPVQLEIREDALYAKVDEYGRKVLKPYQYRPINAPAGHPESIKKAVQIMKESERPFIISGGGITASNAWKELRELSRQFNIPAATTVMGIGTISTDHETYIGATLGNPAVMKAARESDLIIALGCRFSYTMGYGKPPVWNPDTRVIQVDIEEQMIGKNRPVEVGILGDCKIVLKQLMEQLKADGITQVGSNKWTTQLKDARQQAVQAEIRKMKTSRTPIHPFRLIHDLTEFLDPEDIIVADGGDIAVMMTGHVDYVKPRGPRTYLQSIGFGHLGVGIPYAIGAKLACPNQRVACITGDGSFLFNVQELDTAVMYNIPFITIIADNQCWGMIKNAQKRNFKKRKDFCVELPNRDYVAIAQGFGCYAEKVEDPDQILPALQRAVDSGKPSVLHVPIKFVSPKNAKLLASFRAIQF